MGQKHRLLRRTTQDLWFRPLDDPNYSTDGVTLTDIPYPETKEYVERVTDAKAKYIELYYS